MAEQLCLRWKEHESILVPNTPIDVSAYAMVEIHQDRVAKKFIEDNHYSGEYVVARWRFGLYHIATGELRGVAVFSTPLNVRSLDRFRLEPEGIRAKMDRLEERLRTASQRDVKRALKLELREVRKECAKDVLNLGVDLGRLVLLDRVAGNGESLFVGWCLRKLARRGIRAVVSFSDPVPRVALDGRVVLKGHVGVVYQSTNARWTGKSKPDTLRLLPNGEVFHRRAMQKIRGQETCWEENVAKLQAAGAGPLDRDPREWVDHWLPLVTRPLPHSGNHRYGWGLDRWARKSLGPPNPESYPHPPERVAPKWGRRAKLAAA